MGERAKEIYSKGKGRREEKRREEKRREEKRREEKRREEKRREEKRREEKRREEKRSMNKIKDEEQEPLVILEQDVYHSHQPGRVCTTVCDWKRLGGENPSRKGKRIGEERNMRVKIVGLSNTSMAGRITFTYSKQSTEELVAVAARCQHPPQSQEDCNNYCSKNKSPPSC
jgi:hypothetical protein